MSQNNLTTSSQKGGGQYQSLIRIQTQHRSPSISPWLKKMNTLALFCFVLGTMFLHGHGLQRALAFFMFSVFAVTHGLSLIKDLRPILPIPPELKCFTLWVIWAGFTGVMVAIDFNYFWRTYKVILQMLVLVWIIYAILRLQQHYNIFKVILLGIICGGLVQIGALWSGFQDIETFMGGGRALGATLNPNTLGTRMVLAGLCTLFFWHNNFPKALAFRKIFIPLRLPAYDKRKILIPLLLPTCNYVKMLIFLLLPAFGYAMLATGSRKSAITFGFLFMAWAMYASSPQRNTQSYIKRLVWTGGIIALLGVITPWIAEQTLMGLRFRAFLGSGDGSLQEATTGHIRYKMYLEGWRTFLKHPFFGVGLGNFELYFKYSHSNYIEPLVASGLIGFLLYQAFYACVLYRALKLLKIVRDPSTAYRLRMLIIGISTIMIIGLGTAQYFSQPIYILLTAFMVYTWDLQQQLRGSHPGHFMNHSKK